MSAPRDPEDPQLSAEVLEALVILLIGMLRQDAPGRIEEIETALRRWVRAEAGRPGQVPSTRQWQIANRVLGLLEAGQPMSAAELLEHIADP